MPVKVETHREDPGRYAGTPRRGDSGRERVRNGLYPQRALRRHRVRSGRITVFSNFACQALGSANAKQSKETIVVHYTPYAFARLPEGPAPALVGQQEKAV